MSARQGGEPGYDRDNIQDWIAGTIAAHSTARLKAAPLIQLGPIDIADWRRDEDFDVYPQGARAKTSVWAPYSTPPEPLTAGQRYLFKRSHKSYLDQFWAEVVAYRVGCLMGVSVPPTFAAVDSQSGLCGALIEWFFDGETERLVHAGDLLQKLHPTFDRKLGNAHNLQHNEQLIRAFAVNNMFELEDNWRAWWPRAIVFDALIGNTDRHQDNWGLLLAPHPDSRGKIRVRLTPLFDNGTSLGSERFTDRLRMWSDQRWVKYLTDGKHHARPSPGAPRLSHVEFVQLVVNSRPPMREAMAAMVRGVSEEALADLLEDLTRIDLPVRFTSERATFMFRLLRMRLSALQAILIA